MNSTTIRRASAKDLEVIAANNRAMASETENKILDPDTVLKGTRAVLEDESKGFYLVAEQKDTVVGQLLVTREWSDWRNGDFWWLQSVYVLPASRKRGVFRALFDALLDHARDASRVCGLRLYVHASNQTAREVYASLGLDKTAYGVFEAEF
jgi:GNAT superfamily N-acetyltransferase